MNGARDVGARIEELLGALRSGAGPGAAAAAEELVRLLVGLYGDGLAHIMSALGGAGGAGAAVVDRLIADPLVESLLLVHGLHPCDVDTRIQRALDKVRPYLGSHAGGVRYLGVAPDGTARLRLEGACHSCPSSMVTVQLAIQGAVEDAAPEVTRVVVEGAAQPNGPPLLGIGRRPPDGGTASAAEDGPGWVSLPYAGPPDGSPAVVVAGEAAVLVCPVRGTLYAYRDCCPACGSSLAGGSLDGARLACPACRTAYDVRSAGKSLGDPGCHLDPLPLLSDSQGVRVALPSAARS